MSVHLVKVLSTLLLDNNSYLHVPLDIQWISAVGLGSHPDIQHPQLAELDVETTSKSYDMPQPN